TQRGDNLEPDPPQTNSNDSLSSLITPETELGTVEFHTFNGSTPKNFRLLLVIPTLY
ncbi:unnamed protein product, partial [Hymenolepis diminuta]